MTIRIDSIYWAVRPEIGSITLETIEAQQESVGGGCMSLSAGGA